MYEVGIALACRNPSDVLLVRDDKDKFLFDVSTVPHMHLDFTDHGKASAALQAELLARLHEQSYLADARVKLAVASLSNQEVGLLSQFAELPEGQVRGWNTRGTVFSIHEAAVMRLLDKRLIALAGKFNQGFTGYRLTPLGRIVAEIAKSRLPEFPGNEDSEKKANENQSTADDAKPA
jgi:hypothetical protein